MLDRRALAVMPLSLLVIGIQISRRWSIRANKFYN